MGPPCDALVLTKNCPWSYTIFAVDYRGYIDVTAGATGRQTATYYFQGTTATATLGTTFVGPKDDNYQTHDELGISALGCAGNPVHPAPWHPRGRRSATLRPLPSMESDGSGTT